MVCKILFFDLKPSEKLFFERKSLDNYCIKFFETALNENTIKNISEIDLNETGVISIGLNSKITGDMIEKFKNLRVISARSKEYGHIDFPVCIDKNIAVVNIEQYMEDNDCHNLKIVFNSITSVLCGDKQFRII